MLLLVGLLLWEDEEVDVVAVVGKLNCPLPQPGRRHHAKSWMPFKAARATRASYTANASAGAAVCISE